jgi:hypothetical protein
MVGTEPKAATTNPEIGVMRALHQVQLVNEADEGAAATDLPNGTYGFTWAPQSEAPLFRTQGYQSFEIHKAAGGEIYLIGFITAEDSSRLASSGEDYYINLYPLPYEGATKAVSIAKSRILQHREPTREAGNAIKLKLAPVRNTVQ